VQDAVKTAAAVARSALGPRPAEGAIGVRIVHPHVVRTFEHGTSTKGQHFVVMEFVDGVSLNFVRESRRPALAERIELLAQAAEGLAAVHAAGFIHHDFGPKNLLVDRNDQVKLIDFGLAVPNTDVFHRPGNRTGTLNYMAPELLRREATNERLDIFSFGVTAYEFLTGKLPYDATTSLTAMLQRINHDPVDIGKADPRLPEDVCEFVRRLMARSVRERWPAMATVADALRNLECVAGEQFVDPDEGPEPARKADDIGTGDFLEMLGVTAEPAGAAEPDEEVIHEDFGIDVAGALAAAARRSPIPEEVRREVWVRDQGRCVECGSVDTLKFKHRVPLAAGGTDTPANIRVLCKPCRDAQRAAQA
jgi:hypothetical protein